MGATYADSMKKKKEMKYDNINQAYKSLCKPQPRRPCLNLNQLQLGTLVIAEHEGGSLTGTSLSSIEASSKFLCKDNSLSLLLARTGPSLQEAATKAASCHPSISQTQFPLALCFAMTINKSQEHTFKGGVFYVALSRVKSRDRLKLLILDKDNMITNITCNVVFKEVFES
ncbi:hypothetical protein LXL04_019586 [Taraxacum kok-saghyz]